MNEIAENLSKINAQIRAHEKKYGRVLGSTTLIAVSKGQGPEKIRLAFEAGQRDFGENYCQEFLAKHDELRELNINWHFIGKIQSNKTSEIAENFTWVHSVDREKIALRLSTQRPEGAPKLNVCIEVNISKDPNKSGVAEDDVFNLAKSIAGLENINLRGLMTILHATNDFAQQLALFQKMGKLSENLGKEGFALDTLSMGMSGDFEAAIAAGATQVRIGRAIFGERTSSRA